jgi:hypothetical protein
MMQQTRDQFWKVVSICSCDFCVEQTYLKTADKRVGDVVLEEMAPLVVYAGPAPHVFVVVVRFTLVEDCCSDGPHDDAENEEANSEDGVVGSDFLSPIVAPSEVCNHNNNGHE